MSKNIYLYGDDNPPYIPQEVIDGRIAILNKRLTEIQNVPHKHRDDVRKIKILKAINFWETINDN